MDDFNLSTPLPIYGFISRLYDNLQTVNIYMSLLGFILVSKVQKHFF